jgi:hypothetical protein
MPDVKVRVTAVYVRVLVSSTLTYKLQDRPETRTDLERVIEQALAAIAEGRDAVQGLRSSTLVSNELAQVITIFGDGLSADRAGQDCPELRVQVEGTSRKSGSARPGRSLQDRD